MAAILFPAAAILSAGYQPSYTGDSSGSGDVTHLGLLKLFEGAEGSYDAVPDLEEGGLDVGGCDDEVVSPQLGGVDVLDASDVLGVVHRDAGSRV